MAVIKWRDEYSVNVKEMDEQHKKLINIFNMLLNMSPDERKNVSESGGGR